MKRRTMLDAAVIAVLIAAHFPGDWKGSLACLFYWLGARWLIGLTCPVIRGTVNGKPFAARDVTFDGKGIIADGKRIGSE